MRVRTKSGSGSRGRGAAVRLLIAGLLLVVMTPSVTFALRGEVVIRGGLDEALRRNMEQTLSAVVNAIDGQALEPVRGEFTSQGWDELAGLTSALILHNSRPVHEAKLLTVGDGYEVRNIRMQVDAASMQGTRATPFQYLVFSLTGNGQICGVRTSIQDRHVDQILEDAEELNDFAFRQQILQFVEIYRTAYNRKDLEFIERVFSDDALIIVGRVIQPDPDSPTQTDRFENSNLDRGNIEFIRRSKTKYLDALRRVFAGNAYIHVEFDSLTIMRHHHDPLLYGVALKQEWRSTTYGDTGYVFLMLDFKDEENPLIHVRSWQPEKFPDGSTINLFDFELVR